ERSLGRSSLGNVAIFERRVLGRRHSLCFDQHRVGLVLGVPPVDDLQQQTPLVAEVEQIRKRLALPKTQLAQRRPAASHSIVTRVQFERRLVANTALIPPAAAQPERVHVRIRPTERNSQSTRATARASDPRAPRPSATPSPPANRAAARTEQAPPETRTPASADATTPEQATPRVGDSHASRRDDVAERMTSNQHV